MDYSLMVYSKTEFLSFFIIYSFLGWVTEVIYQTIKRKKFINRGFLNGPVCPIYGFGILLVLIFLEPLKDNYLILFAGSVIFTTILEFATGLILEKLFYIRWWDYSKEKFNLNGYICLRFSIVWGLFGCIAVNCIHPSIYYLVNLVPHKVAVVIVLFILAIFAVDTALTLVTVLNISKNIKIINEMNAALSIVSDDLGKKLSDETLVIEEKAEQFKDDMYLESLAIKETLDDNRIKREKRREEAFKFFEKGIARHYVTTRPHLIHKKDMKLLEDIHNRLKKS